MGSTAGERAMWSLLRFQAPGWTREYATGRYRLDFYCPAARLAVEVDGITHHGRQAQHRDRARDAWHADRGILTLRFSGLEVMRNRSAVAAHIGYSVRQRAPEAMTPKARRRFLWLVLTGRRPVPARAAGDRAARACTAARPRRAACRRDQAARAGAAPLLARRHRRGGRRLLLTLTGALLLLLAGLLR